MKVRGGKVNLMDDEFLMDNAHPSAELEEIDNMLERDAIDFEEWAFWHGFYGEGEE